MTHTPSFTQFFGRALMVSGVALLCFSASAYAGFEWRGPIEPPVRQQAPAPVTGGGMSPELAPITAWEAPAAQPAPDAPAAAVESVHAEPVSPALKPFAAAPAAQTSAPQTMPVEGEVLAGFGRDLPLVIALQQVAPAGHQFSFAPGVNPGATVSWEGGKPWQAVMTDMLAPQGLEYQMQGNVVAVGHATGGAVAPAPVDSTMSEMPADDMTAAPADVAAPAATAAVAAPSSEPVTIRRQRPAAAANTDGRTAGSQAGTHMSAKSAAAPAAAATMSYPPETAGSRPVAVNSVPPAAKQAQSTAPVTEASADLAAPPPMDAMSATPETTDIKTDGTEVAPAAATEAPTQLVDKKEEKAAAKTEAKSADVAAAPQKAGEPWAGTKGATLRDTLQSWSEAEGVELYWSIDYDYKLKGNVKYSGSYDEAVGQLLDQFASARPQPYGQLHQGKDGPRVLIVKSYDLAQ